MRKKGTCHFQDTHAKSIDIDLLVVLFLIEFGGHELGRTQYRGNMGLMPNDSKTEVTNLELTIVAIDKDVVAFQVAVNNGWVLGMQIGEAEEDLSTPGPDDLGFQCTLESLFQVLFQGPRGH